jgi:hypothetical protein
MAIKFRDADKPVEPKVAKPKAKEPAETLFPPETPEDAEETPAEPAKKRGRPGKAK